MCTKERMISLGFSGKSFKQGSHICLIYRDEAERDYVISKYIESGLLENEKVGYFADKLTTDELDKWLGGLGIDLPKSSQFVASKTSEIYIPTGDFVPNDMLQRLIQFYEQSISEGYTGARVTGEMSWATKNVPGYELLAEYEARINTIVADHPITALCQYDATKFDGGVLFDIMQVHPLMIVHGQIVKNPAYIRPEAFLKEYHARVKHEE